ncbi:MAG: signal peptidase I [Chloroflexi bacterium]|nr:signal peptidase I [Chloroflexota bacterium]
MVDRTRDTNASSTTSVGRFAWLWRTVLVEFRHVAYAIVWVFVIQQAVAAFVVQGASMEPTLANHAYVIVDTLFPATRPFRRGEVIVFRYPRNPEVEYVKRVIALPGETVAIAHGAVFVNGAPLAEPYVHEPTRYFWGPARVPEDSVFVLGDNRNSSSDSHVWGPLPASLVVGRAWISLAPFANLASEAPRAAAIVPR